MNIHELEQRVRDQWAEAEALKATVVLQGLEFAALAGQMAAALKNFGDLQERLVEHMQSLNATLELIGAMQDATGDDDPADWWRQQ